MSQVRQHETTRVPVTAISNWGSFLFCAEGPYLRIYHRFEFLGSRRIFEGQAIHGVDVRDHVSGNVFIAIWGGRLVRLLRIETSSILNNAPPRALDVFEISYVAKAPDWILDLSFAPGEIDESRERKSLTLAAVTAHDALLEIIVENNQGQNEKSKQSPFSIQISELTSSTRSILYSAHLLWETSNLILVAAGTAFGEIIYWSWSRGSDSKQSTETHRVFLGHEGSIFGVQISNEFDSLHPQRRTRLLASCSDDRTIRIWDISEITYSETLPPANEDLRPRTRHTGFDSHSDTASSNSTCIAIGWGHTSRVWTVRFLKDNVLGVDACLLSSGEDATSRVWHLVPLESKVSAGTVSYDLRQATTSAFHSGKNLWSETVYNIDSETSYIVCGGADSKLTARSLDSSLRTRGQNGLHRGEYTMEDIVDLQVASTVSPVVAQTKSTHKSSKASEFFRSYAFAAEDRLLLTTNSGKVYLETLSRDYTGGSNRVISNSQLLDERDELRGYSVCVGKVKLGSAFIAGPRGHIYTFNHLRTELAVLCTVNGKIGNLFIAEDVGRAGILLLVTLMGQPTATVFFLEKNTDAQHTIKRSVSLQISEVLTGTSITSMTHATRVDATNYIFVGFRGGSVAIYAIPSDSERTVAHVTRTIPRVHEKETVTSMEWIPLSDQISHEGYLASVGRDGFITIHSINISSNSASVVHRLPLGIGPNIEGLYFQRQALVVYGFSSTAFVQYDVTAEEEMMSAETGGSHRSWAFQPQARGGGGGTLVWTRASSMNVQVQKDSSHVVIRAGGHGREIKAVAVTNLSAQGQTRQLIATGAEDTDIKLFEYLNGDFICRRTIKKHTTGIQHLQWSEDGQYLFSSGGCEEFSIWRVRLLPSGLGIGVVCESTYAPESEHPDLRIMSFDVQRRQSHTGYLISMVYSDSRIGVYSYDTAVAQKWQTLGVGTYFTSCLTQCVFLSAHTILTAGTDGHAVFWALPASTRCPHASPLVNANTLKWSNPSRLHQSASKTLVTQSLAGGNAVLVSGGDDGSLALQYVAISTEAPCADPPVVVNRAHGSAITACAVAKYEQGDFHDVIFVVTAGNDQWVRTWEVRVQKREERRGSLDIKRIGRVMSNVADISSIARLSQGRVLSCGVGMEITNLGLDNEGVLTCEGASRALEDTVSGP